MTENPVHVPFEKGDHKRVPEALEDEFKGAISGDFREFFTSWLQPRSMA